MAPSISYHLKTSSIKTHTDVSCQVLQAVRTSCAAVAVAEITAGGGLKSGSPTHSETTRSPLAFIS